MRSIRLALVLTVGGACTATPPPAVAPPIDSGPVADRDTGGADSGGAGGGGVGGDDGGQPTLTATEVAVAIEEALALGIPNSPDAATVFISLAREGDSLCPGADLAFTTPESSCTAVTGWTFYGYAPWVEETGINEGGNPTESFSIGQASFVIRSPEGDEFVGGGGMFHMQETGDGDRRWSSGLMGTWSWPRHDGWLGPGTSVGLEITGMRAAAGDQLTIQGSMGVGHTYLYVDLIDWDESRCEGVPEVALRVRDPSGRWYRFSSGSDCGVCGSVSFDDVAELGEACVDLTALVTQLNDTLEWH